MSEVRKQQSGGRSRERVLETASQLMSSRGYSGTSISAISKASGVLPASIYWHFGNKEGLLACVLERAGEQWFRAVMAALEETAPDEEPARAPFRALRRVLRDDPEFVRLLLLVALERRDVDSESLEALRAVRQRVKQFLRDAFDPMVPVENVSQRGEICDRLALLMLVLIDGAFVARQVAPADTDLAPLMSLIQMSIEEAGRRMIEEVRTGSAEGWAVQ